MDIDSNGKAQMANGERLILIMAGGAGTRFWPASREETPKQFLDILGTGKSLLRQTFERCLTLTNAEHIFIVTNQDYVSKVQEQLPELKSEQIFPEPSRNNTAPCVAYASLKLQTRYPDAVCLVAPSDHIIQDEASFTRIVGKAMQYATEKQALVTLGITPTRPDTGYGYVHFDAQREDNGVFPVHRFTEKPDLETARTFLDSGEYLWNSGMFIWTIAEIIQAFDQYASGITEILRQGMPDYFTEREKPFLAAHYPQTEKISIDYAIMERAKNVAVLPASFGWSDLGTWTALYDHLAPDQHGNISVNKPVVFDQCSGTLIYTLDGKLVVASGLKDFVVINEADALLIFPKDQEQEVKRLRENLRKRGFEKYL